MNGLWECSTNGMNEHMELSRKVKIIKGDERRGRLGKGRHGERRKDRQKVVMVETGQRIGKRKGGYR